MARLLQALVSALLLASPPVLAAYQTCASTWYDDKQYTCYHNHLCPFENGVPMKICGSACYSSYMYQCTDNILTTLPEDHGAFTLTAVNPTAPFHGKSIEASGLHFWLGKAPTAYCPAGSVVPESLCETLPGNETIFYPGGLSVFVPGGQATYIATSAALTFTQAHSGATPNVTAYAGPAYQGGAYTGPNGSSWVACPVAGEAGVWQVFAFLIGKQLAGNCTGFYAEVADVKQGTLNAWEYV